MKAKYYLKKVWGFIKKAWYWIIGIIVLIGWVIYYGKRAKGFKQIAKQFNLINAKRKKDYEKSIENHEKEIKKRREVIDSYNKAIEEIDKKYDKKEKELASQEKKEVKNIASKYEKDPDKFVEEIADTYNLEVVE